MASLPGVDISPSVRHAALQIHVDRRRLDSHKDDVTRCDHSTCAFNGLHEISFRWLRTSPGQVMQMITPSAHKMSLADAEIYVLGPLTTRASQLFYFNTQRLWP